MGKYSRLNVFLLILTLILSMTIIPSNAKANSENLHGIGLKDPTVVYSQASTSSTHLKSYAQGSALIYRTYNTGWYEATVIINGQAKTGYINKNDVETIVDNPQTLQGISLSNPTPIYSRASTNSQKLKTYDQGTVLMYETFTSGWYKCWVYVNGKLTTGYINKNDVENITTQQQNLRGIGLDNPTKIYSSPSTSSVAIKYYDQGTTLYYQTFTSHWYECTVYVNGKRRTGYIYRDDVEGITADPQLVYGVGLQSPTVVYSKASTNSSALKSYSVGSNLIYQTFTSDWYEATVYVNGKPTTGYIYKNDVDGRADVQKTLQGIGLDSPTKIYSYGSIDAPVLKSYDQGSVLWYETFSDHWYQAIVYVNGSRTIGYINKNDVEQIIKNQQTIRGIGLRNPTNAYSLASTSSRVLKDYSKGSVLTLETFTSSWYEATVYVNGEPRTAYFKKTDISQSTTTNYGVSLNDMVNKEMARSPMTDQTIGYLREDAFGSVTSTSGVISGTNWNVRSGPSTSDDIVGVLQNGARVEILGKTTVGNYDWYEIRYNVSLRSANENEVAYYLDPKNVKEGSSEYYEFLKLSSSSGLDPNEVNQKILVGQGILEGQGQAFVSAAKTYDINEIYLINHAFLETGHGTSDLAKGVKVKKRLDSNGNVVYADDAHTIVEVDVLSDSATKYDAIVYNMYGIGAVDGDALHGGARMAYNKGWTTPEKAIVGGAQFVSTNYIHAGQDTLYKMRWNPDTNSLWHQYATDIGWAEKQTYNYSTFYGLLDNYSLLFDVPVYN